MRLERGPQTEREEGNDADRGRIAKPEKRIDSLGLIADSARLTLTEELE